MTQRLDLCDMLIWSKEDNDDEIILKPCGALALSWHVHNSEDLIPACAAHSQDSSKRWRTDRGWAEVTLAEAEVIMVMRS